jgi:hypothetical protein
MKKKSKGNIFGKIEFFAILQKRHFVTLKINQLEMHQDFIIVLHGL